MDEGWAMVKADVVILTALGLEYDAVRAHLRDPRGHFDSGGTRYEVGVLRGGSCRVALAEIGEGNLTAASLTGRAIEEFAPKALVFTGIAGGLKKDVKLGDVVVATKIYAFHGGREGMDGFLPRPRVWSTSHPLEQVARDVARVGAWRDTAAGTAPAVHFKPVCSGGVVIDSQKQFFARLIKKHYSDAIAVDMESAGVAEAAFRADYHRTISVRGVSDAAGGEKSLTDQEGWQPRAAERAAAFAVALAEEVNRSKALRPRTPSQAHTRRRWATALGIALLVVFAGALSIVEWLGVETFHTALGVDVRDLPIGADDMVLPVLLTMCAVVLVAAVMAGAFLTGAALVPWADSTWVARPATALAITLYSGAYVGLLFVPNSLLGQGAAAVAAVVLFGFITAVMARDNGPEVGQIPGTFVGAATIGACAGLWAVADRWLPSGPWPPVAGGTGLFVAAVAQSWWLRVETRRRGPASDDEISPAALIRRYLVDLLPPGGVLGRVSVPWWQARRVVIAVFLGPPVIVVILLWMAAGWVDNRAEAARAVLAYGYIPRGYESLSPPRSVEPATISLRRGSEDPEGVCRASSGLAASLLISDEDADWVLLRPIDDENAVATVRRLPKSHYEVRRVFRPPAVRDGVPWKQPACLP